MMNALAELEKVAHRFDIQLLPFFVLSPNDPHKNTHLQYIYDHEWSWSMQPNSPLGDKAQAGLKELSMRQFDYLMHLDTDDVLNPALFRIYEPLLARERKWFGSVDKYIYDVAGEQLYYFAGYPADQRMSVNGGRMIHRTALQKCQWQQWTKGIEFGLNYHQKIYLEKAGYSETLIRQKETPCLLEIKTDLNIHTMDWFHKNMSEVLQPVDIDMSNQFDVETQKLLSKTLENSQ